MNTMTPDDHDLGERVGRALDLSALPPMSIELGDVRRGARARRTRRRVGAGTACVALAVGAVVVLSQRDEPTSSVDRPPIVVGTPAVGAAGLLPVEQFGEPTAVYASRGGVPRGTASPQVDVWQSGEQRIIVRTFLEPNVLEPNVLPGVDVSVPPPTTALAPADGAAPVVEQLADDQWVMFLTAERDLGDNVVVRGMTRDDADAAFAALVETGGVLAPTGYELVEHADAVPASSPASWSTTIAFGRDGGDTFVTTWAADPDRAASVELGLAWSTGAVESIDGREVVRQPGLAAGTSLAWRDPSGVFVSVLSPSPVDTDLIESVELIDQPALLAIADSIAAQHAAKPVAESAVVGDQVVTRRGDDTDVVLCIGSGESEACARAPGALESGPPIAAKVSAIVDGHWVIAGMMGTPDGYTPDFSDERFTLPDGTDAPVATIEQDGTYWFVVTVPDGVDVVTVSPYNELGGIVGPIARPLFAESIG